METSEDIQKREQREAEFQAERERKEIGLRRLGGHFISLWRMMDLTKIKADELIEIAGALTLAGYPGLTDKVRVELVERCAHSSAPDYAG